MTLGLPVFPFGVLCLRVFVFACLSSRVCLRVYVVVGAPCYRKVKRFYPDYCRGSVT